MIWPVHTAAIARYLDSQDLVTFGADGADCFLELAPADPVDAVTIMSLPGPEADGRAGYDSPRFQVIVRAAGTGGEAR